MSIAPSAMPPRAQRWSPHRFVHHRTQAELTTRTRHYPELPLGDLVARAFHDWDDTHGLDIDGGVVISDRCFESAPRASWQPPLGL